MNVYQYVIIILAHHNSRVFFKWAACSQIRMASSSGHASNITRYELSNKVPTFIMCIYVCLSCDRYHLSHKHANKMAQTALCFIQIQKNSFCSFGVLKDYKVYVLDVIILLQDACAVFHQTDL